MGGDAAPARLDPRTFAARDLMREAEHARQHAYAPYSRFLVGAALLAEDGTVFHGCNVENASYGATVCAERNAMFQAVALGIRRFTAIAVTAREGNGAPPCGVCRQVLHEFAPRLRVMWRSASGRLIERRLDELLPNAFVLKREAR
jgi:cytidine deaminase